MRRLTCPYCGKSVRLKPIVGGMHLCLTSEERAVVDRERASAWLAQIEADNSAHDAAWQRDM